MHSTAIRLMRGGGGAVVVKLSIFQQHFLKVVFQDQEFIDSKQSTDVQYAGDAAQGAGVIDDYLPGKGHDQNFQGVC